MFGLSLPPIFVMRGRKRNYVALKSDQSTAQCFFIPCFCVCMCGKASEVALLHCWVGIHSKRGKNNSVSPPSPFIARYIIINISSEIQQIRAAAQFPAWEFVVVCASVEGAEIKFATSFLFFSLFCIFSKAAANMAEWNKNWAGREIDCGGREEGRGGKWKGKQKLEPAISSH